MLYLYQQRKGGKEMEAYLDWIFDNHGDNNYIDLILEDVNNDKTLTEDEKDELWEFGDCQKRHD